MRKIWLALFPLILTGCLATPSGPSQPIWGLGIEIPEELPAPGPYLEPPDQIAKLDAFIRSDGFEIARSCDSRIVVAMNESLAKSNLFHALQVIIQGCGRSPATPAPTPELIYAEFNRTQEALSAAMPPRTVVETELLGKLMFEHGISKTWLQLKYWEMAWGEISSNRAIFEAFPWETQGNCTYPHYAESHLHIMQRIGNAKSLANQSMTTDEKVVEFQDENGRSISQLLAETSGFENITRLGWWPAGLRDTELFEWDAATAENLTRTTYPTLEEAKFILAEYRHTRHTLSADDTIAQIDWVPDNLRHSWTTDTWMPLRIYAFQGLNWEYAAVQCTGG